MNGSPVTLIFLYWAFALVSLSAALVLLAVFYRLLGSDLGLGGIGKEFWIAATASLIQAGEVWFLTSLGAGLAGKGIVAAFTVPIIYKLGHLSDWDLMQGFGLIAFQGVIYSTLASLIAGNVGGAALTVAGFSVCLAVIAGVVRSMFGVGSGSSDAVRNIPRAESKIHWLRLALIRLCLGLCGIAAGLLLAAVFVTVWHLAALLAMFLWGSERYGWAYAWDVIFLAALLWGGYRYKARMPPPSPFTNPDSLLLAQVATGNILFTPQQAAFSVSEMLFVAPRLLFWGIRHIQRIALPSNAMAESASKVWDALRTSGTWIPYEQLQNIARSEKEAAQALAMLVKAEFAEGRLHQGVISFRASAPEWI